MSVSPFFSVVIPTKNRSHLVGYAVQSVLNQSFTDYEIVVVDNDDTQATREIMAGFQDQRIRYFRTGNLPMHDNWEYGCRQACGEYVTMIEDKEALRPRALERIYCAVERDKHNIVTWLEDFFDDRGLVFRFHRLNTDTTKKASVFSSQQVIRLFLTTERANFKILLPRGTNSCCHRSLIKRIVDGPAGRLCLRVSPDYTMAFLQLAYSNETLHIDEALVVAGMRESNGRSFQQKKPEARVFMKQAGGRGNCYDRVPIKASLITNGICNDFLKVRDLVGNNLAPFELDLVNYFVQCYGDIASGKVGYKVDMSQEEAAWNAALRVQEGSIQSVVRDAVRPMQREVRRKMARAAWRQMERRVISLGRRAGLGKLRRLIRPQREERGQTGFPDILAAIEWRETK